MRIGIDATALPPQPVGAGNYMIQLVRSLSAINADDQLVVFAQNKGRDLFAPPEGRSIEWQIVEDRKPGSRLIWEQTQLTKLVHRTQIDLLHSLHYTRPFQLPCASVVTFHDMTFFLFPQLHTRARRLYFPTVMKLSARRADAIISVSESTRKDAIRLLGIDPARIFTAHLGVDSSFQPISDQVQLSQIAEKYDLPDRFILYVGTIEPRKNLPLLIKAYREIVTRGTEHKLVLVGNYGWMYEEVLTLIEELNLSEFIHLPGYVSQSELPLVYNLAELFVYPTIYEGFGLPVLEAMACGVPVITSRIASLPEVVADAGILIPVDDIEALSEAMRQVLLDNNLKQKLIHDGMLQAKKFSWERTAELTWKVYRQVLENKERA